MTNDSQEETEPAAAIHWPSLLEMAARVHRDVWRIDPETGYLERVTEQPADTKENNL